MAIAHASTSLHGLAIGDALGEARARRLRGRTVPGEKGAYRWTDDTAMALSLVHVLRTHGRVDADALAAAFARRFVAEPWRGYAGGATRLLAAVANGADWRVESRRLFGGEGSMGNGAAMRVAPLGAFYAGEPDRAASEAAESARVTHQHADGQAGAIAVAVAASLFASPRRPHGGDLLRAVLAHVPAGAVHDGLARACQLDPDAPRVAAAALGTGQRVLAADTVPWCLWVVAHDRLGYHAALETAATLPADLDTVCAIVGGVMALADPAALEPWPEIVELLPAGFGPGVHDSPEAGA